MRKNFKSLSAILMTSVLAVSAGSMAMPAFADYTITMSSTENHTYTAYQIFDGDLHESGGTKTLSNVTWGANINGAAFLTALQGSSDFGATNPFTGKTTAAQVASIIDGWNDTTDASKIKAFAKLAAANLNTTAGVSGTGSISIGAANAGYYLIKDTTTSMPNGGTYSDFILEVVSDVTVAAKDETVTSEKKVTDKNDSTGATVGNQTTADYDIGDDVPYVLTFTLPTKYAEYSKYPITFTDDMCAGLTYNGDAKIYYGKNSGGTITYDDGTALGASFTSTDISSSDAYNGGKRYTYTIADLKATQASATAGTNLATLGAGDVIKIEYTAKLNSNAVVGSAGNPNKYNVTFANDPNWYDDGTGPQPDNPPTGNTPPKENKVYTYKVVLNKTDGTNALTGADFELYKFVVDTTGTDSYTSGGTTYNGTWTNVTALNSGTDKPTKAKTASGSVVNSVFTFSGIDDGHYKLVETATPPGYNSIDDIEFDITPTADGDLDDVSVTNLSLTADDTAGSLTGDVVNSQGVILPGTGGMGTTVFYIVGGLLVAGALVLLIVKKRMNIKEK
ncbi:isopeptide-forming domain-containing fimbrial protein [Ruminococcus flavefaciens]|uniref:isopeptide-forming domain-containing fimbrial protein n=1 Tax=Ruminococcus flavefaciens TaxID=1265 RepID=UPI0018AD5664|nr:isopeptide-forming domain-containing fimbrial protein [Ruminococcus flavefaciens]